MEGRILFRSPALSEFFKTSNFELNLRTGGVFTYLDPPEDIGIKCQKEPFDLEFLRDVKCKEISWTSRCHVQRRS